MTTFRGDAMMAADGPRPKPWRCGGGVGALDARGLSSGGSITERIASSNGIESAAANSAGEDGSSVELGGVIRDHDGRGSAASSSSVGSSAPPNKRFQKGDGGGGAGDRSATGGAAPSFWLFIFTKLGRSRPMRSSDLEANLRVKLPSGVRY